MKQKKEGWPKFKLVGPGPKSKIVERAVAVKKLGEEDIKELESGNPVGTGITDKQGHYSGVMVSVYTLEDSIKDTALDLFKAAEKAQCACKLSERLSGHKTDCWMPELNAAICKAIRE